MTVSLQKHLELLAPAGSIEAFFAALEAGADAVYCGLKEFSARAKAKNFTLEEMARLTAHAHREGCRLYVTLNTLVKEAELTHLVEILAALDECRIDGLIVQDLGVWRLARTHFPELSLHASTQMAIHNAAGVKMLEHMGFTRGVLARELSLAEITAIRGQTRMELEHFIHGALCYSISGLCLFSSYLTGKSGNRGRCAQPCRRRFQHDGKGGFYFSTSDLCAIAHVPQLVAAGVMSFKIEGRMKNAEYVAAVVAAYRKVLDAGPADQQHAIKEAQELLASSFGRLPTRGFLLGNAPADLSIPTRKGGIGQPLGKVARVEGATVCFTTAEVVHVGDRLRIQPESDMNGLAFTVKELVVGRRPVKRGAVGASVRIPTPFWSGLQIGDQIYKLATGQTFTLSEEACWRRLAKGAPPSVRVELMVTCRDNALQLSASAAGTQLVADYDAEMIQASHSPLTKKTLQQTFGQTGQATLVLGKLTVGRLLPVVIQPSRLKEIRRDFYNRLAAAVESSRQTQMAERLTKVRAMLLPRCNPQPTSTNTMTVVVARRRDLAILDDPAVQRVILPLAPDLLKAVMRSAGQNSGHRQRIIWDIPAIIYENDWRAFQTVVRQLLDRGFAAFRLNNLGHFQLFARHPGLQLLAGSWLYVLNSQAAQALQELGARECTLSLEDDRRNLGDILDRVQGIATAITVYSPIALVTSRIPMRAMRSGTRLKTEGLEETISVDAASGLTVARPAKDFSLLGLLHDLRALGCNNRIIDLTAAGYASTRGQEVLRAAQEDRLLPDTSLFNFVRGLE